MHVFMSHAVEDADEVNRLADHLRSRLPGLTIYVSGSEIAPGADWWQSIQENLRSAQVVVVAFSRRSVSRPWLFFEGGAAWALGKPVIPVLLDGLSPDSIPPPFSFNMAISCETDAGVLIAALSEATGIASPTFATAGTVVAVEQNRGPEQSEAGVYLGDRRLALDVGWVRYAGSGQLQIARRYVAAASYDEGYRFPPSDTLDARAGAVGFRVMPVDDVHFYLACTLTDGRAIKLYVSTNFGQWGFSGTPLDEFRVPLTGVVRRKWNVVVLRFPSFETALDSPIRSVDGFRIRGGMRLSHVWCRTSRASFAPLNPGEQTMDINYPS
ncbi:MAG: hypothetical protein CVU47_00650 [Chloroflexi bacterium HGW-Chloroflexi-9]|nr:MAG: hypothetical protein CVU47_00650 [Chloroflexi bacterium HGW-Chloroflexi-9]